MAECVLRVIRKTKTKFGTVVARIVSEAGNTAFREARGRLLLEVGGRYVGGHCSALTATYSF